MNSTGIVRGFWEAMRSNDFNRAVREWLAVDYIGLWPQSAELIRGPGAYAAVNNAFPGRGDWRFEEISLLADGDRVATDMRITNAPLEVVIHAITFHDICAGKISRQTEYWPDSYPAPAWRAEFLERDPAQARF